MRKIISKSKEEKKKRRNQLVVGGIMIAVLLFSTLGYAIESNFAAGGNSGSGNSTQLNYNGITFTNQNGYWIVNSSNGKTFAFTYNPEEIPTANLGNITLKASDLEGKALYIYSNNSEGYEMKINLIGIASGITGMNLSKQPDCSENSLIIENGNLGARQSGDCIFISGQGEDLIKLEDNVLFKLLGITN